MASKSPIAVLYGNDGTNYIEVGIRGGIALPSGQPGILGLGSDGTNTRYISVDSSGRTVLVGAGANGAAVTGNPALIAGSDGTNARTIRTATDGTVRIDPTGTTTQPISATTLPLPTGAATETTLTGVLTTSAFQARINTLGQKTMANSTPIVIASDQSAVPVSGTITANIGTSGSLALEATQVKTTITPGTALGSNTLTMVGGSVTTSAPAYSNGNINQLSLTTAGGLRVDLAGTTVPLPTGAATETTLAGVLTTSAFQARINTLGQKTMANSTPITIASDQSALPVSQSGTWNITNISGTVSLPTGAATETTLSAINGKLNSLGQKAMTGSVPVVLASDQSTIAVSSTQLPAALVGGRLDTNNGAWLGSTAPTVGQKTMANSIPVVLSSDQAAIPVSQSGAWTVTANAGTNLNTSALALDASILAQSLADNSAFTDGTTRVQPVGFIFDEVAGTALTENDAAAARIDAKRAQVHVIEDGTTRGTRATVKAASTAAVAGDTAFVVGLHPNSPLPAGSNTIGALTANQSVNVTQIAGTAVAVNAGVTNTGTQRVIIASDQSAIPVTTTGGEEMTYTVVAAAVTPGNNKSMLSIYNPTGSGYVLKLREFYIRNAATAAVTGVAGNFELHRFASGSAPTGGTTVTVLSHDSADALPASMDARTGGTISGEIATPLDLMRISTDEWGPGTADVESNQQSIANYLPARAKRDALLKPFYARAGEGLHMKFATNSTAGSIDVVFVFTKV